jgi:hypothetical protein
LIVDGANEGIQVACRSRFQVVVAGESIHEARTAPLSFGNKAAYDDLKGGQSDV